MPTLHPGAAPFLQVSRVSASILPRTARAAAHRLMPATSGRRMSRSRSMPTLHPGAVPFLQVPAHFHNDPAADDARSCPSPDAGAAGQAHVLQPQHAEAASRRGAVPASVAHFRHQSCRGRCTRLLAPNALRPARMPAGQSRNAGYSSQARANSAESGEPSLPHTAWRNASPGANIPCRLAWTARRSSSRSPHRTTCAAFALRAKRRPHDSAVRGRRYRPLRAGTGIPPRARAGQIARAGSRFRPPAGKTDPSDSAPELVAFAAPDDVRRFLRCVHGRIVAYRQKLRLRTGAAFALRTRTGQWSVPALPAGKAVRSISVPRIPRCATHILPQRQRFRARARSASRDPAASSPPALQLSAHGLDGIRISAASPRLHGLRAAGAPFRPWHVRPRRRIQSGRAGVFAWQGAIGARRRRRSPPRRARDVSSGREVALFFSQMGWASWVGALFSAAMFGALCGLVCHFARQTGAHSFSGVYMRALEPRQGVAVGAMHSLLMAMTAGVMLTACGELAMLALPLHGAFAMGMLFALRRGAAAQLRGMRALSTAGAGTLALLAAFFSRWRSTRARRRRACAARWTPNCAAPPPRRSSWARCTLRSAPRSPAA